MTYIARTFVALLLLAASRLAAAETVTGNLNFDGLPDTLSYDAPDDDGNVTIQITLATPDGKGRKLIRKRTVSEGHIDVEVTGPGEITFLSQGDTAHSMAYYSTYRYNPRVEDWFLVKTLDYQSPASGGWEPAAIRIRYEDGVARLGGTTIDKSQAETESADARRARLEGELAALHYQLTAFYKSHKLSTVPASASEDTRLAELIQNVPVSAKTVEAYNNIGYFLLLVGNSVARCSAIYVLDKVVKAQPDRTPAYLNLADGYFDMHNTDSARSAYTRYIELMKRDGKASKIPQRAIDRAK